MNPKSSFESILNSMPKEVRDRIQGPLEDVFKTGSVDSTLTALYIVKNQIDTLIQKIEEKKRSRERGSE